MTPLAAITLQRLGPVHRYDSLGNEQRCGQALGWADFWSGSRHWGAGLLGWPLDETDLAHRGLAQSPPVHLRSRPAARPDVGT
jgi:hypothetical protein